jgi:hypothetical protein
MFIRYIPIALFWIVLALICWAFAPVIARFMDMKTQMLPKRLGWFQTDDNLCTGDDSFKNKEMAGITDMYVICAAWLRRNPAYGWLSARGVKILYLPTVTVTGNPNIDIGDFGATFGKCYRTASINGFDYFDWKLVGRWSENYGYMLRFGWNLAAPFSLGEVRNLYVDVRPRIKLTKGA